VRPSQGTPVWVLVGVIVGLLCQSLHVMPAMTTG